MIRPGSVMTALASLCLMLSPARAQRAGETVPAQQRPADSVGRVRLEDEVRRVFARAVRQRVGLDDDQMNRLRPLALRYEGQRRDLQRQERDTRVALRRALQNDRTADANVVDRLLQTMVDIEQRRAQLLASEQRDLAGIMTPVQRAKYVALQEQVRRRLQQMRQRRAPPEEDLGDSPATGRRPRRRVP